MQEGEKKKTKTELRDKLMENFLIGEGAVQLKISLVLFNNMIEDMSKEAKLESVYQNLAEKIDGFAKYILKNVPYISF